MSGICALLRLDGVPVSGRQLSPVLHALAGWGSRVVSWDSGPEPAPVALGACLQPITPEDAFDEQPAHSRNGACTLVADARIDNREQLATVLGIRHDDLSRTPDSALILAAYEAWGHDCVGRLIGDFAFLLWDSDRGTLVAARDAIGQRVLFHHRKGPWLAIASSPAALTELEHVPARLNEERVADFLMLAPDPVSTFFEHIDRLPAGHVMVAGAEGVRTHEYWKLAPRREILLRRDGDYVEAFREVFDEAVRARLRSAGQVGTMLSAGLDSSSVATVAARQLQSQGKALAAFHAAPRAGGDWVVQNGWIADESGDVRAIAGMYDNVDLTVVRPDGLRLPFDGLDAMFTAIGMPIQNAGNRVWIENIYELARQRGMRVLLSGQKGNATISYTGLRSLREAARKGHWAHVQRELRAVASQTGQRTRTVIKHQIAMAFAPRWMVRGWARVKRTPAVPPWENRFSAIRPEFARAMRVEERLLERGTDDLSLDRMDGLKYRALMLSASDGYDYTHAIRAWHGVETRDPTSDRRVVEFCLGIPGSQYLSNGQNRLLVRRAMRGLIPDSVLDRGARGEQSADWSYWLAAMRPGLERDLARIENHETARRCIDVPRLRTLLAHWPASLGAGHMADYRNRLLQGVMAGRFILWFEERFG